MVVIAFLFLFCSFFSLYTSDGLSAEQRAEAREFIRLCFDQLEGVQQSKVRRLGAEIKRTDEIITRILASEQIDYRKFNVYEMQKETFEKEMREHELYQKSLERPKEKIVVWQKGREAEAYALYAYMTLSDEWQLYKIDPLNMQVYGELHKRMLQMAEIITPAKGDRIFVAGTHAYPSQSDEKVNYDVDRVFFLALYLLNKDLQAERESARSSQ